MRPSAPASGKSPKSSAIAQDRRAAASQWRDTDQLMLEQLNRRRGIELDDGHGPCHGNPDGDRRPIDGHVSSGRDCHPSNLRRTSLAHNVPQPSGHLGTVADSSIPRAICNGVRPDTNTPQSTRTPVLAVVLEQRTPREVAGADQCGFRSKPEAQPRRPIR